MIEQIGNLSSVGLVFPSLPVFNQEAMPDIISILPGAVTLALLGLFQTVAAMRRMNRKIGGFTDSRKGILSDAVSNCLLPFLSSLPTCASVQPHVARVQAGRATAVVTSVSSALFLLLMVLFLADLIAIIPMPAMAAMIMLLGANMINWEDIKPHLQDRREAVVFIASFLSVLFLDLFGAVLVGSVLAIAYSKWEQAHPSISLRGNVLRIRGNIYYGSLPVIEATYHRAIDRLDELVIDFSECYYIDPEGIRWLAAAKAGRKVGLIDRRSGEDRRIPDRREGEDRRNADGATDAERREGEERRAGLRRRSARPAPALGVLSFAMARRLASKLFCAAAIAFCTPQANAADKPYELGVLPYLPLTRIHELYGAVAGDLGAKLGRQVRLSSKADYRSFREELRRQTYDIGFVQPFDYVDAHDKHGYLPLARRAERLDAVIVVREDSPLRAIKDLEGRTLANPPMDAAVSFLTTMALREAGIDPQYRCQALLRKEPLRLPAERGHRRRGCLRHGGGGPAHHRERKAAHGRQVSHPAPDCQHSSRAVCGARSGGAERPRHHPQDHSRMAQYRGRKKDHRARPIRPVRGRERRGIRRGTPVPAKQGVAGKRSTIIGSFEPSGTLCMRFVLAAFALLALLPDVAPAQTWPAKPVRIVVAYPAGRRHRRDGAADRRAAPRRLGPAGGGREQARAPTPSSPPTRSRRARPTATPSS